MYFTSLVRIPRSVNPLTSVRRPGTTLDDGQAKYSVTNSAGEGRGYSPVQLPDSPNLEVLLQNIEREHRESDGVGTDKVGHDRQ